MKILVTGGAGFIGQHLVEELTRCGHQTSVADIHNGWDIADGLPPGHWDVVIHLAAQVGRLFGEDDVLHTCRSNVGLTAIVAKECGERGIRLVYASTSEVYGDNADAVCDEDDGPFTLPHNLYGLTKGFGEAVCDLYAPDRLTIWRISMPYGPGLPAGRGRAAIVNMLHQAHHGEPIPVHKGAERSWCWIGDTVRAMRMTLELSDGGTFNIGRDDNPVPMLTVAKLACDIAGASYDLIEEVDAPGRQTVVKRLATERIRALGWEPHVELEDGMRRTYEAMGLSHDARTLAA